MPPRDDRKALPGTDHTLRGARQHPFSFFHSPGIPSGIHHLHMAAKDETYIILSGLERKGETESMANGKGTAFCPEQVASARGQNTARAHWTTESLCESQNEPKTTKTTPAHAPEQISPKTMSEQPSDCDFNRAAKSQ